ncbi:hypothetical protein Hdeb2414_s0002g00065421 [Helianthus debilis subsp. tardiflorus]
MCWLCGNCLESVDHFFTACHFSQTVWQIVATWCHIQPIFAFHIKDLLDIHKPMNLSKRRRKALQAVIMTVIWSIWKSRNEAVFRAKDPNMKRNMEEVTGLTWDRWKSLDVNT